MNSRSTKLFVVERSSSEPAIATVAIASGRSPEVLDMQLVSCPLTRHDCDVLGAYLQIAQRELVLAADTLTYHHPTSPLIERLRHAAGEVADYRARLQVASSTR